MVPGESVEAKSIGPIAIMAWLSGLAGRGADSAMAAPAGEGLAWCEDWKITKGRECGAGHAKELTRSNRG